MYIEAAPTTTEGSNHSRGQFTNSKVNFSEQWSSGPSEQSLLRFSLSKIGALVPPAIETIEVLQRWEENSTSTTITGAQQQEKAQIIEELVLEEIESKGTIAVSSEIPLYELPYLAQDSGDESTAGLTGHTATDE